jgi:hypothetical protein
MPAIMTTRTQSGSLIVFICLSVVAILQKADASADFLSHR